MKNNTADEPSSKSTNYLHKFADTSGAVAKNIGSVSQKLKQSTLRNMFWGRGGLYKNSFHILIVFLTVTLVLTGIINSRYVYETSNLDVGYGAYNNNDLLPQGATVATVVAIDEVRNFTIHTYTVKEGDTLDSIAKKFKVSKETIKWANSDQVGYYTEDADKGEKLKIPEINGILEKVEDGDTVDKILGRVKNGNKFDVIELNDLTAPEFAVAGKKEVFIPNATKDAPPRPNPNNYYSAPDNSGYISPGFTGGAIGGLPAGFFDDPLTHPSCSGYRWGRGFRPGGFGVGHTGVDLLKGGGCVIRAAGDGVVTQASRIVWATGLAVVIDHGGGVETLYYHNAELYVRAGERVSKGQAIAYMGCTGNCYGTHLHLTMLYNGAQIDPAPYIPYRR